MKKSISVILMLAMLLSSVLAIIPMSAATEGAERTNLLFSNENASNYQFEGNGNVFYYDYHYYVDTNGTFPLTNKAPSLRVGVNSGAGTATATDGKPFSGSMNHQYSDDCATLTLADGITTVTHDHVFGYSFKESVTIDSFKLYASADKENRDNISRVTVYGATLDPNKKYDEYKSGQYYYSTVTTLYTMPEGANVQDNRETAEGVTAAVVSGNFEKAATVDYILFAVDFDNISSRKYTVYEVEAYDSIINVEGEDTSNGIKVNFGDIPYRTLVGGKESAYDFISVYDVILDGNSLATVANSNTPNEKSFELGYVAQSEYAITSDSYYVYEFKAKLNRDTGYAGVVFASNGTEHYFAGGAFANDGDHNDAEGNQASHIRLYKNDWLKGSLDFEFGDHYRIPAFVEDGYGSWRVVYDGLTVNMQYLAKDGYWTYITREDGSKASITLPEGFFVAFGAHNRGGAVKAQRTVSIKDAIFYNGPVSDHPVDKTALEAYIKYVEKTFFDSAKYEVSIWAAFENALTAARDVSAKEGISQDVIDARLADLQNAVAVLKAYEEDTVYTDKTALYAYIEYVEKTFVYSVKYEASSWAELESALATAKDVSTQYNISQYDVDQALAALKYAVSELKINNLGNDVLLDGIVPEKVDFGSLTYKTLESGKESVYNFAEMYDVIIDGNSINTLANSKTSNDKAHDLGYVAQTEYAIVNDSYY